MPTPQKPNKHEGRWLAHHIICRGKDHGMAILTIREDGTYAVEPFTAEVHSTSFHSGTITVEENPTRLIFS